MEFIDLKAQYKELKTEIDANIQKVLAHGRYLMGPEVGELEQQLAEYVGVKHCITCANGTDALHMVLMAWGIKEGDAVFVPTFTFMSTAEVVSLVGATPVFTDINLKTFNMDAASLEQQIEKVIAEGKLTPKAIITVDLFGQPADYNKILLIAKKYNLLVLEDGAQGFGGNINGKLACSFGDETVRRALEAILTENWHAALAMRQQHLSFRLNRLVVTVTAAQSLPMMTSLPSCLFPSVFMVRAKKNTIMCVSA